MTQLNQPLSNAQTNRLMDLAGDIADGKELVGPDAAFLGTLMMGGRGWLVTAAVAMAYLERGRVDSARSALKDLVELGFAVPNPGLRPTWGAESEERPLSRGAPGYATPGRQNVNNHYCEEVKSGKE